MTMIIDGTNGLTFPDSSQQYNSYYGFKNRIINGDMRIDQRNAGASVTPTGSYTLDRWYGGLTQSAKYSVQRNAGSVTPPAGFTNYLGATSLSAYSVLSGDNFNIQQRIEGFNVADLGWGTANAQTVTLSFWVRSSITGTHSGALWNNAFNRSYPFTFTVSAANTWEQKSVTIAGDTSGTWTTDNSIGVGLDFNLGSGSTYLGTAGAWAAAGFVGATGSVSVVGTNGATFYITGVQLEKGSTATSFDYRPYGTELMLCQRYLYTMGGAFNGSISYSQYSLVAAITTTTGRVVMPFPVAMRAAPSFSAVNIANTVVNYAGIVTALSAATIDIGSPNSCSLNVTYASNAPANSSGNWYQNFTSSSQLLFSAEL